MDSLDGKFIFRNGAIATNDALANLEKATQSAHLFLADFATDDRSWDKMTPIFGNLFDSEKLEDLRQQWTTRNFSQLPTIEIRSAADIQGAKGAFSSHSNLIYLSQEFLTQNLHNSSAIADVLLHEIGHFIDWKINPFDTPGEEGEVFSAMVQGNPLSYAELQPLKTQENIAAIALDGQIIFIEKDPNSSYTGANLDEVKQGLDKLLSPLDNAVNTLVFANSLPLIGKKLQSLTDPAVNFIANLRQTVLNGLTDASSTLTSAALQQALFNAIGPSGLNWLKDADGNNIINLSDIQVNETATDVKFNLKLGKAPNSINAPVDFDIGLPGLNLTVNGNVKTDLGFDFDLGFGVNSTDGFYFDSSASSELKIKLDASVPDLKAKGKLGFLQLDVTDEDSDSLPNNSGVDIDKDGVISTKFNGTFAVDVKDADNKLTLTELNAGVNLDDLIDAKLNGAADVNLNLVTSFAGSKVLPSINSDLNLDWSFSDAIADRPSQPDLFGNAPAIGFNKISLNLGTFFNDFVAPILDDIQTVTKPLQPVIDVLTARLPVLDDLGRGFLDADRDSKVTLLDLAQKFAPSPTLEAVSAIVKIADLVNSIPTTVGDIPIKFGSFNLGSANVRDPSLDPNAIAPTTISSATPAQQQLATLKNQNIPGVSEAASAAEDYLKQLSGTEAGELKFPIIEDPQTVFNLLLGKQSVLFSYDMPPLKFGADPAIKLFFPILGPLGALLEGSVEAKIDLAFGYDTDGFQKFASSGDPTTLLNGFYVSDRENADGTGLDVPEAQLTAAIKAYGALELVIASAGVGGGIAANINLDLHDGPDNDGKVRIATEINECLFEVAGELTAGLEAFIKFGFGPFSYKKRFDIAKTTLLSFAAGCTGGDDTTKNYGLATDIGSGVLRLNMGPNAGDRVIGGIPGTDVAELFTVQPKLGTANSVEVAAFGVKRTYANVSQIIANGGNEEDSIAIGDAVLLPTSIVGGNGNDQLYGGGGNDHLDGGANDDGIYGSAGNDNLLGSDGDDLLVGGSGADNLDGGTGDDATNYLNSPAGVSITPDAANPGVFLGSGGDAQGDTLANIERLEGSNYNDILTGNDANNVLEGFSGNDAISGSNGDDFMIGGVGADTLDGGSGNDATTYLASPAEVFINLATHLAFSGDADGDVLTSVEEVQGSIFNDLLIGDSANNSLDGFSGDDTLDGGAGADTLNGSAGNDWGSYNTSVSGVNVSLKTGTSSEGDALLFVPDSSNNPTAYNALENLEGSAYNDILEGDLGANTLKGLSGDDVLRGEDGSDTLIGGNGADNLDGGANIDWADYSNSAAFVSVNLAANSGFNGEAHGDTFVLASGISTVENLLGSDYGDNLVGDDGSNEINPGLSNSAIDVVDGGNGDDRLDVNYSFNDTFAGMFGGYKYGYIVRDTSLDKTKPIDQYPAGHVFQDRINFSNIERFFIIGTLKTDQLFGGPNADILLPGAGDDIIYGGRGNDWILADDGNDFVMQGDVDGVFASAASDNSIILEGGRGIDTLSVDLSGKINDIILESTTPDQEKPNDNLFLAGAIISQFEVFQDINTGDGSDRLVQLGRVNNHFNTGAGNDTINAGLGFDAVDGGSGKFFPGLDGDFGTFIADDDVLIIDYSLGDTGGGLYVSIDPIAKSGSAFRAENPLLPVDSPALDSISFTNCDRYQITGTSKDDRLVGGDSNDTLEGGAGNDNLTGDRGNDSLMGGEGNDTIAATNNINYGGGEFPNYPNDIDTLTGAAGADNFILGDANSSLYANASTSDYALITDFDPNQGDVIQLYNNSQNYYFLASSPDGLPTGIAIYLTYDDVYDENSELIGIIQGATNLSLDPNYFIGVPNSFYAVDYTDIDVGGVAGLPVTPVIK